MDNLQYPRFPLTGQVQSKGFAQFISDHIGAPRANIQAFGHELSGLFAAPRLTLVNSGSSANLAAALACRELVGQGEALIAGFTFPTTVSALKMAGFSVRVIDTEPGGFCMDPEKLISAIQPNTKVICLTHFLGFPAQLEKLCAIARAHGALVIQDACETLDLPINGVQAHSYGDFTTWSFYHPHHLSSYGGGAVITRSDEHFRLIESITHWGRQCTCHIDPLTCTAPDGIAHNFWYVREGQNLELSELNACFGLYQLQTWDEQERMRLANYAALFDALHAINGVKVYAMPERSGSPFVFPITVTHLDLLVVTDKLRARGVETRTLMGGAISRQPAYLDLPTDGLANCSALSSSSFFVGIHQTLPAEDVASVSRILAEELS